MRYLALGEVLWLHRKIIATSGGASGLRDLGALESALAQPQATYAGADLYASLPEKAAALAYALIMNHPFVDGNKRVGHAALETMLMLNGFELRANVDDQEALFLAVADGKVARHDLLAFVEAHLIACGGHSA